MKYERLKKYWEYKGFRRPAEFARALGISSSHISEIDQRKSNKTIYLAIRSKTEFSDLNLDWLETGTGAMLLPVYPDGESEERPVVREGQPPLHDDQLQLLELWSKLSNKERKALLLFMKELYS